MSSTEITNLTALRNLLADLPTWVTWTGLATTPERLDRIAAPELSDAMSLPAICIDFGSGRRINPYGSDSSANFRPSGQLVVSVYDLDAVDSGSVTERYTVFADRFFGLIDSLIEAASMAEIMINNVVYPDAPIIRGPVNVRSAQDENADKADDAFEIDVWFGTFSFTWGGPPES
ncbi:MAG: hypothetical protein JNL58_04465 [Planctomyces sp.]|nr:hypothetical protein [Planctomyces sp.]